MSRASTSAGVGIWIWYVLTRKEQVRLKSIHVKLLRISFNSSVIVCNIRDIHDLLGPVKKLAPLRYRYMENMADFTEQIKTAITSHSTHGIAILIITDTSFLTKMQKRRIGQAGPPHDNMKVQGRKKRLWWWYAKKPVNIMELTLESFVLPKWLCSLR